LGQQACESHCDRTGASGCSKTIGGYTYNFCGPRTDLPVCKNSGKWPPSSPDACRAGCAMASVTGRVAISPTTHSIEMGRVAISGRHWTTFNFQKPFLATPVVAMLIVKDGPDAAAIRIKDVTPTSFSAVIVEPQKEKMYHLSQMVSYLAAAPGISNLPDGRFVVAGSKSVTASIMGGRKKCKPTPSFKTWDTIGFSRAFETAPVMITQLQTNYNEDHSVPKDNSWPWMTVSTSEVTASGAKVAIERSETSKKGNVDVPEEIGFVAIEQGVGQFTASSGDSVKYAAVVTDTVVGGKKKKTKVNLGTDLGAGPLVVGSKETRNGNDGGWLRLSSAAGSEAKVWIDEDKVCDKEAKHPHKEAAGIFAASGGFAV